MKPRDWNQSNQDVLARPFSVALTTTPVQILTNNPDRVALVISSNGTAAWVWDNDPNLTTAKGILVVALGNACIYRQADVGTLVTGEIWGIAAGAATAQGVEIVRQGPAPME